MPEPNRTEPTLKSVDTAKAIYFYYSFSTKTQPLFGTLHELWYPNGTKVIPANIASLLTPIMLAFWLMDDGGWTGPGIHLSTNGFTYTDVVRLSHTLGKVHGLKCTVHSRNRIYIWARSVPKFIDREIVSPHIHTSMAYKIDSTLPTPRSPRLVRKSRNSLSTVLIR
jgi:hypothetical protein